MYLRTEKQNIEHPWTSKSGKKFTKTIPSRVCYFSCDLCGQEFSRKKSDISPSRLNNKYSHFCTECFNYGMAANLGRDMYRKTLESRIGKKVIDSEGYVRIYVGSKSSKKRIYQYHNDYCGSIREHTLIMEQHLGRALEKGEVVHHIDGDKTNNKITNLQLMSVEEHNACHAANDSLVMDLFKKGVVKYDRSKKRYVHNER